MRSKLWRPVARGRAASVTSNFKFELVLTSYRDGEPFRLVRTCLHLGPRLMERRKYLLINWLFLLLYMPQICLSVKPVFDYSNNMRLVLLPADTKLNSVIYRLRASDADEHYPLKFTAYGKNFIYKSS